jgi:hypothetical protein
MLCGGRDGLVDHLLGNGGWRSWRRSSCSSRTAAGVITTPRRPREARSSTAQTSDRQERSPGSRPITLVRRRVSPKVRSTGVGVPDAAPMLSREPQVHRERGQVVGDAGDRCGVAGLPGGGECGGPALGGGDRRIAGFGLADVEDRPAGRPSPRPGRAPTPWPMVLRARWTRHRWRRLVRERPVEGAGQPRSAVADRKQRRPQPTMGQIGEDVVPGVGRL